MYQHGFHLIKPDELLVEPDTFWRGCPECEKLYYRPLGQSSRCILPHADALLVLVPEHDPNPALQDAEFCLDCGWVITSPADDLLHTEACESTELFTLYTGGRLWHTEAR